MKTKINFKKTKLSLVGKAFICFAIAMLTQSFASYAANVTVYNNTSCAMQMYCDDNGRTYNMGTLDSGKSKTLHVEASYGHMYCRNKQTGQYAKGLDFFYGNYDLYVNKGCPNDDENGGTETPDNTPQCDNPTFNPCSNVNVLDFTQAGIDWDLNDMAGSYTAGDQTFDVSINDADGIFAAFQDVQVDPDDEGSYENNTGIAVGINPNNTDDVIEINYNLSLVSDYVAFTIRDLDKKYYSGSQQIEEVCVYGYLDGVEILPTITSLCGSVEVNGNCAVATDDSANGQDESIRIVFETCINEIKIVYGNADNAANDPTYSRIFIGDDIGFGTAVCTDDCIPCTAEASVISLDTSIGDDVSELNVCLGDNPLNVNVTGGTGENAAWVITDEQTNIVSVGETPPFTFNEVGTFLVWYLNWDGDLAAAPAIGANAGQIVEDSDCAALSNSIKVVVEECCSAAVASIAIAGNETINTFDICVNDEDLIVLDFILVEPGSGESSAWVITDENTIIQSVSVDAPSLDLYGTELGTMQIWYLNWDGDLSAAPDVGANAGEIVANSECAALSDPVVIIKDCCCPYSIAFTADNTICPAGNLILRPVLVEDSSLVLDNGDVVCEKEGVNFQFCSDDPKIIDSAGNSVPNLITTAGEYTAQVDCNCAPDATFIVTEQILSDCNASAPVEAPLPLVMEVTETSAIITYDYDGLVAIQFRKVGDPDFFEFESNLGMASLLGLDGCTNYEYRLSVTGANGNPVVSDLQTFTTAGCAVLNMNNMNLRSLDVRSSSAILSWNNVPGCIYNFYYRVEGETEWRTYDTSIPFIVLFGLNPCTNYEWALSVSDDGMVTDISSTQLITTTCQGPRLSNPSATDVKIGDLSDIENIELDLFVNYATATLNINYMGLPVDGVEIYSTNGQLVKNLNINNTGLNTIDVSSLNAGVYILVSNIEGGLAKNKFIISK